MAPEKPLPRIEDDPEHQAATAKLRQLAAALNEVEERERIAKGAINKRASVSDLQRRYAGVRPRYVMNDGPGDAVREAAKGAAVSALLEGRPMPAPPLSTAELERLGFEAAALREAVCRQSQIVAEIEGRVVERILEIITPVDRRNVAEVLEKAQALADALDMTLELRRELAQRRVAVGIWPDVFWFARGVGSRKDWHSPLSRLARSVTVHIGPSA